MKSYIDLDTPMEMICENHGVFLQTPKIHRYGSGCPKCNHSKGERAIEITLDEKHIFYETQKKFDGLKDKSSLRCDFYIPKLNLVIEYNGKQHYEEISFFGGNNSLEANKKRDSIKKQYCFDNNIRFEIIRFDEDVKTRLDEILENQ
ncbi:MAG: hypothetical protein ISP66_04975 [Flavobacteriaceae bacterium]|nr:hypothetical protein [Flavobacteriaceae bacterium]